MKEITTVGVDLAKSVCTVHGVDAAGRTVLRKTVRREKLMELGTNRHDMRRRSVCRYLTSGYRTAGG
jgi:hypothetical protein